MELRPGTTHCQNGTAPFLKRSIDQARMMTGAPLLVRMDGGNDSLENIKACREEGAEWLIKRNPRRESEEEWLKITQEEGERDEGRPERDADRCWRSVSSGEEVWWGERWVTRKGMEDPLRQVFKVTRRTVDEHGHPLLLPQVEVESYWTSLGDAPEKSDSFSSAQVAELYERRGTAEQFHSEIKTDLDLERLPSGKFVTNAMVLLVGMFVYNILRLIGQLGLGAGTAPRGRGWSDAGCGR